MERYNVVIIGAGNIGAKFDKPIETNILTHAHACFNNERIRLLGFYDKNKCLSQEASYQWGGEAFDTLNDAVKEADIVSVCVPDKYHFDILKGINENESQPKLVIMEKPVSTELKEIDQIELMSHKIPVLLNYSRRFIKQIEEIKTLASKLGKLKKGICIYGKGTLHNGSHIIDLLGYIFGTIEVVHQHVDEISDYSESDTSRDMILRVGEGLIYLIALDARDVTVFEVDLLFQKGRIKILNSGEAIEIYQTKESEKYKGYINYCIEKKLVIDYSESMKNLYDNAINYLDGNEELKCTIEDGIQAMKVCIQPAI